MSEPQTLGRYRILGELGRGAMGVVYKASDPMLNRTVAIKTISIVADAEERVEYEKRFYQEAKAAGGLSHPHIVTIFDIGRAGDVVYMAMEFVEGSELKSLLASRLVEPPAALDIAAQVAEALAYAHSRGIVHRDVKPANIMVVNGGPAKIMDFGIARMRSSEVKTQTGMLLGSPKYMAPEQLLGGAADHRSDIFALGVVVYEMAVGASPFAGDDITQIMYHIVHTNPPPPSAVHRRLPAMLDLVVARALAKDPEERYQDARELAADLRACAAQLAAATPSGEEEDATQTLPIASFPLPDVAVETTRTLSPPPTSPQRPPARETGPRLRVSRRFDSTAAMHRLAASHPGDAAEQTVKLDLAAVGAASEPPATGGWDEEEAGRAPHPARARLLLWAGVTIAALVAVTIALA
ncbi:MAG: serine/threonine-protein kinase [Burkholderiales bacterium]